jgi:hypothetical protein
LSMHSFQGIGTSLKGYSAPEHNSATQP